MGAGYWRCAPEGHGCQGRRRLDVLAVRFDGAAGERLAVLGPERRRLVDGRCHGTARLGWIPRSAWTAMVLLPGMACPSVDVGYDAMQRGRPSPESEPIMATLAAKCALCGSTIVVLDCSAQQSAPKDEADRAILAVLEQNGRISNNEPAARVGPPSSPCLRRVRQLEEAGVIRGYRALIDPAAAGRSLRVFAGVRPIRHTRADVIAFERWITHLPGVIACHHITGTFDYLLQAEVAGLPAYENFHADQPARPARRGHREQLPHHENALS